jgi:hypothetical protein
MSVVRSAAPALSHPAALSVVIASVNGWDVLEPTLRALDAQPERARMEIIVVDTVGGETWARLQSHQPAVVVVAARAGLPIPRLRYLGVKRTRGELVAILEDHGTVNSDWAYELLRLHQEPWGAVGGPVENGRTGWVNWAAYFCEYLPYMQPMPEGPHNDLPGNNIAYKRPHLMRYAKVLDDGKWESWINDRLRADGVPIAATNRAVVHHIKDFRLRHFLIQRFHFARSYAGMRRSEQTTSKRLLYGLGSSILPALLLARITRLAVEKNRHMGWFVACLPLVALMLGVGAAGEMAGYFFGSGRSLEKVR